MLDLLSLERSRLSGASYVVQNQSASWLRLVLIGVLIVTTSRSKTTRQSDADADLRRLAIDARVMAVRLGERASAAYETGDAESVTWLHKQLLSTERRYQEREAGR